MHQVLFAPTSATFDLAVRSGASGYLSRFQVLGTRCVFLSGIALISKKDSKLSRDVEFRRGVALFPRSYKEIRLFIGHYTAAVTPV